MKVLFVCTGNICRSPLAEALLRRLAEERGRADITVASAGTGAFDGGPASEGSYLVGLENGLDLSAHKAQQLTSELVADSDLILCMSRHHVERARRLGGDEKAVLLGSYAGLPDDQVEIDDPFGGDIEDYRRTWGQLSELMVEVLERIPAA